MENSEWIEEDKCACNKGRAGVLGTYSLSNSIWRGRRCCRISSGLGTGFRSFESIESNSRMFHILQLGISQYHIPSNIHSGVPFDNHSSLPHYKEP